MDTNGNIYARFDSNTENVMRQYENIESLEGYLNILKMNLKTTYVKEVVLNEEKLKKLYEIKTQNKENGNYKTTCGAPWYGNNEEIDQRKYLSDGEQKTDLLQQYSMPTVEIIYIIQ